MRKVFEEYPQQRAAVLAILRQTLEEKRHKNEFVRQNFKRYPKLHALTSYYQVPANLRPSFLPTCLPTSSSATYHISKHSA
jgi:hypothetical protein